MADLLVANNVILNQNESGHKTGAKSICGIVQMLCIKEAYILDLKRSIENHVRLDVLKKHYIPWD